MIGDYIAIVEKENPTESRAKIPSLNLEIRFFEDEGDLSNLHPNNCSLKQIILIKFCLAERKGKRKLERPRTKIKAYFFIKTLILFL